MKTMNVMRFNGSLEAPALVAGRAPIPVPASGEILVRVLAAGVTPTELLWYPTTHARTGEARIGAIPGHEFSGVVEAVGAGVDPGMVGRDIFGMNDWFAEGATADYCLSIPASVTEKPVRLSHAEAASVPIGALTAWQGLADRAKLQAGERILVHGGSGAVGIYAVQLAKRTGAHVITTASARNADLLLRLGADEVIDYRSGRFEETARDLDVVFDGVGGETLRRSWDLLKPGGRMVTIAASSEEAQARDERIAKAFFIVEPNREQLAKIAGLLDAGDLRCGVGAVVPGERASDAYRGSVPEWRGGGKTVLSMGR